MSSIDTDPIQRGMTWEEIVETALNDAWYVYEAGTDEEAFVATAMTFYEEYVWESRVTSWPVDPYASHRMARSRFKRAYLEDSVEP